MTILALVPDQSKMCLQENLVDCADCGGLNAGMAKNGPKMSPFLDFWPKYGHDFNQN